MEDGIERSLPFSLFDKPIKERKILYLCCLNESFKLDECIITDNKQKMQELMKKKYKVSIFIADINELYNYVSQ
jgi:hypothetical protein